MPRYWGQVEIVTGFGDGLPKVVWGPRTYEVSASSRADAKQQIEELAHRRLGLKCKLGQVLNVRDVHTDEPSCQSWYAFRSMVSSPTMTSRNRSHWGDGEFEPGDLYSFTSRAARDAFVEKDRANGEHTRAVRVKRLPKGWYADHAVRGPEEAASSNS